MVQWKPLFEGQRADPYEEAVVAILQDVDLIEPSLDAGPTLLKLQYALVNPQTRHREAAAGAIDGMFDAVERLNPARLSLFGGVAGVGWVAAHAANALGDRQPAETYIDVDAAVYEELQSLSPPFTYDLISGVVGYGVYLRERMQCDIVRRGMDLVVDALVQQERVGDLEWHTPASLLPATQLEFAPRGYANLGMAHGVPGVVALLASLDRAPENTKGFLARTAQWLLNQRLVSGFFPAWVCTERPQLDKARLAWCYGELGVAIALLKAAIVTEDDVLRGAALNTARLSASRTFSDAGVLDAGLCHGAAGVAHLFNRFYQCTGDAEFRVAALNWFERALNMRRTGTGIGGFSAWRPSPGESSGSWQSDPSFLGGSAGVALAFLAAITHVEPAWDRMLLCDLPLAT